MIKRIDYTETLEIRRQVLWPNKDLYELKLKDDESGYHYGFFIENELVGVISLFIVNESAQFRKFAVLREHQNKGIGSKLLKYTIKEAKKLNATSIWCNARTSANGFYERFGLEEVKGSSFFRGTIEYSIMKRGF